MSGTGNTFSATVNGFTNGETISYACKFAFAGGLAVTKYFSYQVGDVCALGFDELAASTRVRVYPNPAKEHVNVSVFEGKVDKLELFSVGGKKIKEVNSSSIQVYGIKSGLYLIKVYQGNNQSFHKILIE